MDVSRILDGLNEAQREAVAAPVGNMLVLAGAGSGKTRVLVHRIAWLIEVEHASPWSVLAVTFTNKAAKEMRSRIEHLLGTPVGGMWVGTFHGLAHRLLRSHWEEAGLPKGFQILDSEDQYRLIRRTVKALELDEARWPPRQAQGYINARKDEGLRPEHLDHGDDPYQRQMIRIYREYQAACDKSGLVDFAELLLRAHELWLKRPDVLAHYRQRFAHVLVDEFQDTNAIQYAWLRLLTEGNRNLFVVGDDDQSIYGWRGAKVENVFSFQEDNPDAQVVRLEQNYRSTGTILTAANSLIANNPSRMGKELWTEGGEGEPIALYAAFNEVDEARFVVDRIRKAVDEGSARSDIAVLYRSNAQSRVMEDALIQARMPYRVYGGLRFFERAEIKDALAYLRLLGNRHDDASFERAVNNPPRGIGPRTVDLVRDQARLSGSSLWAAAQTMFSHSGLTARAANSLRGFLDLIANLRDSTQGLELGQVVEATLAASGLRDHFEKSKDGKGIDRVENLDELVSAAKQFHYEAEAGEEQDDDLMSFLAHAALEAGEAQGDAHTDCVQLMTLHSAKGLEFDQVYIVGLEEGLFPHSMSANDPQRLEEERRLCYVGMTRAMRDLCLSYAESRRLHGSETYPMPSRFLREVPPDLIREIRPKAQLSRPLYGGSHFEPPPIDGLRLGSRVNHPKFGEGVILSAEGQGGSARVQVNFDSVGSKWLVVAYANLQAIA